METKIKLQKLSSEDAALTVDLSDYVNASAVTLSTGHSLARCYALFRSQGLRHLVLVDGNNRVENIVTRKDLMGFALEERIAAMESQSGEA